jgi:DNA polymerase III subunit epsilon
VARALTDDEDFRATTFAVIDFETTTPRGHSPEPIEVAVILLRAHGPGLDEVARFTRLMRPPEQAPVTPFDTSQTGITPQMVATLPPAGDVLADLDAWFTCPPPALLVAHHAPTEAGVIYHYRQHCPRLAVTHLLDTVRLARAAYPHLHSHGLDVLRNHLQLPRPAGRHRAMPDTQLTADLFRHLISHSARSGLWPTMQRLRDDGGYQAPATKPRQEALFD